MVVENAITEAINPFHRDALSATIPLNIEFDLKLTILATTLYCIFGNRMANGIEKQTAKTLYCKFIQAVATTEISSDTIDIQYGHRAHHPSLKMNGFKDHDCRVPWLGNRKSKLTFD